jgi:hypothetical protein
MKPGTQSITNLFPVLALLLATGGAFACSCFYVGTFDVYSRHYPIVVRGTVTDHGETLSINSDYFATMGIEVNERVKGDYPHDAFDFYGDTGMSCLRYITAEDFPLGSEHFFILSDTNALQPLLVCGESSVRIEGNTVHGQELGPDGYTPYAMPVDEFLSRLE